MREEIEHAQDEIKTALSLIEQGVKCLLNARLKLDECDAGLLGNALDTLPRPDIPVTEHRRLHKSGRPPKIDCDTEVQAFILSRIDRMTYAQLADDIAAHFPKKQRVSRSTINRWWNGQNRSR